MPRTHDECRFPATLTFEVGPAWHWPAPRPLCRSRVPLLLTPLLRRDRVVPLPVELVLLHPHPCELLVTHLDPDPVRAAVQLRLDLQPRPRPSVADQVDDHAQASQRPASPVLGDVAEH